MRTLIESSLRGNIVCNERIDPNIRLMIKVDLAEMELAIVNIAVNARDAMPNGGVFTLTAGNVKAHDERVTERQRGDFVTVEFNDTGMAFRRLFCLRSSIHFSQPRRSAREPGWVYRRYMVLPIRPADGYKLKVKSGTERRLRFICRHVLTRTSPRRNFPRRRLRTRNVPWHSSSTIVWRLRR
jgi:hypothetical protein